jgi:hypothetical protein
VKTEPEQFEGLSRQLIIGADSFAISSTQDVEPIVDHNLAAQNEDPAGWYTKSKALRLTAKIPLIIVEKWRNELGIDCFNPNHWPAVRRLLNSSDWYALRTVRSHLG